MVGGSSQRWLQHHLAGSEEGRAAQRACWAAFRRYRQVSCGFGCSLLRVVLALLFGDCETLLGQEFGLTVMVGG